MAGDLRGLGYATDASAWSDFLPRRFSRNRPDVIIADMDRKAAQSMDELSRLVGKTWGKIPVIALIESTKFKDISFMLDNGAADCISKSIPLAALDKRITRALDEPRQVVDELTEEIPLHLLKLFIGNNHLVPLEDVCSIHAGASPRHPTWRRMAPPDNSWRGVLTAAAIDRFQASRPDAYLRWSKFSLFRMPEPSEYAVREKVLLRHSGPPMVAAIDRSHLPAGAGVYSLVPNENINAGFLACFLNSRLLDFYFNRLAKPGSGGHIHMDVLRRTPVPIPSGKALQDLNRIAVLLEHFGPNPESWIDRQTKNELLEEMERIVFSLYQANENVVASLEAMHF